MKKTKIAFVKFGGCSSGGSERFIHAIAANLSKEQYQVDFYYCDAAPYAGSDWKHPDTDQSRVDYLKNNGVNLIKFNVGVKDVTKPHHPWLDTNFFELFKEEEYDIIQSVRAGHPEFPFTEIHNTKIVDIVTLPGMAENKPNVYKTIHISKFQANTWIKAGGPADKIEIIPIISEMDPPSKKDLRDKLNIPEDAFVFGFHQRDNDGIFTPIALEAYKRIQTSKTYFVVMGGSAKYAAAANQLGLKNFIQIPHSGNNKRRDRFLATLDVFTHNRADGETYGLAIAEAMYYGLPVVSHVAPAMGHVETIGNAGHVHQNLENYAGDMLRLLRDKEYYDSLSKNAVAKYHNDLKLEPNMKKIITIYEEIMSKKALDELSDEDFWESV